jgi:uncharacterized membrane protein
MAIVPRLLPRAVGAGADPSLWLVRKDLGTLGGDVSVPTAINEHDQIVGGSSTTGFKGHAVLWTLKRGT